MAVQHINQVELSRRWRLSPRTLERWRWQGTGPAFLKVGGRIVYRLDDIEAYDATRLHETGARRPAPPATPIRVTPKFRRGAKK